MNQKEAIILKNLNYKETSKLVYCYTSEGLVSMYAKGAHRKESKVRSLIEPITCVNVTYSNASLPTLIGCDLVSNFTNVKYDLEKQVYALHLLELVYRLCEDVDHSKIYLMLKKAISLMDNNFNHECLSFSFELKLLFYLGFGLDFDVFTSYMNVKQEIHELYYIKFDDINTVSYSKEVCNKIRKEIDILYNDFLQFKTNSRTIINDMYGYY